MTSPLRIARFRALWSASIFSAIGTFVQSVAGSWLMLELTNGSNTWVGLMVASSTLPLLFFSLTAGALADMFDRAKIMVLAQSIMAVSALSMALLTHFGRMTPGILLLLGLMLGMGGALNLPSQQALLPELVPREMIPSAIAFQSAGFNAARAVGPAIGGAIVAAYGAAIGFGVNSISYLAMIAVVLYVASTLGPRERENTTMFSAVTMGIRYARYTEKFRNLLTLSALYAITSAVVQAVLPGYTTELRGTAGTYGFLLGAMGTGALIGVATRNRITERGVHLIPFGIFLFGVFGILLGFVPNLALAAVCMAGCGAFWLLSLSTMNTTAQLIAPDWIKGRAMALYNLSFSGIAPLGSILTGVVADQVGIRATLISFSIGSVVLGLLTPRFRIPKLEEIEEPAFTIADSLNPHLGQEVDESISEEGPVVVLNTWVVDEADIPEFLKVMQQLRLVRLTTGAYRWGLMRNVSDPTRFTEVFANHSWYDHLAQHRRIDDDAAAVIKRARAFDRSDGPMTRHLISVDVLEAIDEYDYMRTLASHEEMHATDGSIPLPSDETAG
ncbi:MAG: MFS transporter [Actinomycetes bacterium]|jgi:MFS family permease